LWEQEEIKRAYQTTPRPRPAAQTSIYKKISPTLAYAQMTAAMILVGSLFVASKVILLPCLGLSGCWCSIQALA
jgi:hypothetical protein